jgi:hypothetical protein
MATRADKEDFILFSIPLRRRRGAGIQRASKIVWPFRTTLPLFLRV